VNSQNLRFLNSFESGGKADAVK